MISKVFSAALTGLESRIIEIEAEVAYGLRHFNIVGLPDKAVEESKERVGAAINSSLFHSPQKQTQRVLINLAPADLKKQGSLYDLPIALAYLTASKQLIFDPKGKIFIGELALDGKLRPINGVISIALMAREKGFSEIILPKDNALEAALVRDLKIIGVENLKQAIDFLSGKKEIIPSKASAEDFAQKPQYPVNLSWVKGQHNAKRALEIAAAGGHNLL